MKITRLAMGNPNLITYLKCLTSSVHVCDLEPEGAHRKSTEVMQ